MDLADAKTKLTKNHQYNGDMSLLGTQPSLPHSPLTSTLVTPSKPPSYPLFDDGDASILAHVGYLLDVRIKVYGNVLFGVYQDCMYQNTGNYLDD